MNIYKLRIVKYQGDYRKNYKNSITKEYAAGSLEHALQQGYADFSAGEYVIYIESQRIEMDMEAKEKWFHAITNKVCQDCG